ncbi:hypothetical protein [Saliphagus sp. LR7]|uniref:hypothetical protein n=1 Tax=Saliphagus sp. LR7 TaxID=2282654 RepID=UPI000DF751F8|nr:hypothetical protein [Saliphagus sp. LR7]
MLLLIPLQAATGGSLVVVVLTLIGLLATATLALIVAYLLVKGYRENQNRARLSFAIGLILLTTGPIVLQFTLTTFTDTPQGLRSAAANTSKLLGLAAMLYAIYGVSQSNQHSRPDKGSDSTLETDHSNEVDP